MSMIPSKIWQSEFGIDAHIPNFFESKSDIDSQDPIVSYAHVVRRAFDLLELDGVWCDENAPLVYFKLVKQISVSEISELHHRFWNHGGAAILVIISPHEVQIYSGLAQPVSGETSLDRLPSFVTELERASNALEEFLPSVESGEFFRRHAKSFDTKQRVDQALLVNLQATREKLAEIDREGITDEELDAFLCRLVFTCYLFDREIIGASYIERLGLPALPHLRDILGTTSYSTAKEYLYRLFHQLAQDFNGDLFSDDLDAEANLLSEEHLRVVEDFFRATDVTTKQKSFWPYDFGVIPIETVSAIYERFLKPSDKNQGAVYTPRFLAELVLDIALNNQRTLLGKRFLDPACGSGIFLVGLFNRIAEEWRRENPRARNDRRARELMQLMQDSIFGIDINPTACRITAFSLYLAYLDQLTPRDIQDLQAKGNALPRLVTRKDQKDSLAENGNILCGDFFQDNAPYPIDIDVVVGNPPWGSIEGEGTNVEKWFTASNLAIPNKQIAAAFMWKAAQHISDAGQVCLLLPQGVLFNPQSIKFQKNFLSRNTLDIVLNLTDYQRFLFSEAEHPAIVVSYRNQVPSEPHSISYWFPKVDWKIKNIEVITIPEYDRRQITLSNILNDLEEEDTPQIWKRLAWATPRDLRLLDRLTDLPRLRDAVRQVKEESPDKPWLIAEGFQPVGPSDDPQKSVTLSLPSNLFIETSSSNLNLFLLKGECTTLESNQVIVRSRSNKTTEVFEAPHVLLNKGFSSIAFADFPVSFRDSIRGITGPQEDRELLIFLAAYLNSSLAKYFMFHISSNWGVNRSSVYVKDILQLPFLFPSETIDPPYAQQIVGKVVQQVTLAMQKSLGEWVDRDALIKTTLTSIEPLILEYFDILPSEQILINDTLEITIPSFRPTANRRSIPAIKPSSMEMIKQYTESLCQTLNSWAKRSNSKVVGVYNRSLSMGVGLVILQKVSKQNTSSIMLDDSKDIMASLNQLKEIASQKFNTFELIRGVKAFEEDRLYILKPLGKRHWTESAALNDADEIASSILMQSGEPV